MTSAAPEIKAFFDPQTFTVSYVVSDPASGQAAVIDSVLDYDPKAGRTRTDSADKIVAYVREHQLSVAWHLETHAHADHLSAAPYLKQALGGRIAIGEHITTVQATFGKVFNTGADFATDGRQFDHLFTDGACFAIGGLSARVLHTPGHTPACVTYLINDAAFVGDTLFMPDYGTARCDFPGGDAGVLYRSIRTLLGLPGETRLFMCHDYQPGGRAPMWETTVAAERAGNIHVHEGISEAAFVAMRTARDKTLDMPVLILPAVQVNMRAGHFPPPEANGVSYLKIPLNML
ncbi:MBL fold metallo-hydrolase [Acidocella sp.]|uniref:MBL fold metallo-hydrolase n=1 Tax=Acidocella sp. TaxID=50710 RepID=UPI0026308280|nr:MBL fold metallo-hydrolase [Acidocella sp.]